MKIFLSSTFIDLKQHRNVIDKIINRMSLQYVGMEYFGAREFEPKSVCFQEISKCDLFIGIYAHRYGWIPDGDKLSITEQEYDYAKSKGLPCLLYHVEDDYPWKPKYMEWGENKEKLAQFKTKIKKITPSGFTTPDNISMQIAADLVKRIKNANPLDYDFKQICKSLNKFCNQEIKTNIGPKYIPDLFVKRNRSNKYISKLYSIKKIEANLNKLSEFCAKILMMIDNIGDINDSILNEVKNYKSKVIGNSPKISMNNFLSSFVQLLNELRNNPIVDNNICYPAILLSKNLDELRNILQNFSKAVTNVPKINKKSKEILEYINTTKLQINKIHSAIKPITMLVERAGGGKTNLLCDISLELSKSIPVFFITAKSIAEPNSNSILNYIKRSYPISDDPLEHVLSVAINEKSVVLIVIDGINEHYDPQRFNIAINNFVKEYYGKPIRYLFSCRDIYWRFFSNEWWNEHCDEIISDELRSFSPKEFKEAIPKYFNSYNIKVDIEGKAKHHLKHPLLLRFFCEAYKGTAEIPTNLGKINDVRLLPLFDIYCIKKFEQIRKRLGLFSSNEISEYVEMVGLMMLKSHSRFIPISKVRKMASEKFGEREIYTTKSKYAQILDEDILLEQIPDSSIHKLNVEFVYEEFMEYVIANSMYSQIPIFRGKSKPSISRIFALMNDLLRQEKRFVPISGILIYIGEIVARNSNKRGLDYIKKLVERKRRDIAFQILNRWTEDKINEDIIKYVISLNLYSIEEDIFIFLEKYGWRFWEIVFNYIINFENRGWHRANRVYVLLRRTYLGINAIESFSTLRWMGDKLINARDKDGGDFKSGVITFKHIVNHKIGLFSKSQKLVINKYIQNLKIDIIL